MKNGYVRAAIGLSLLCLLGNVALAAEQAAPSDAGTAKAGVTAAALAGQYTEEGADTCIKCHDEDEEYPVFDIFKTKHGQRGDKRSPFAGLQCEACHGPGIAGAAAMQEVLERGGHVGKVRPGQERPPILNFGIKSDEPVEIQNASCLSCHQDNKHIDWQGSAHGGGNVACATCHTIHVAEDPVLQKDSQPEVCFKCHKKERAEFYKPSHHPIRFAEMTCSECHAPHGSVSGGVLIKATLNQTCYTCHAEKRGPFLWEHAPVAEDCSLCHSPHGSIHPALLTKRAPLLCQQCHSQAGHPSVALTAGGLPGGSASGFLLGGACMNCHVQVHGSNHPSGVKLMR
ncbi:MAG: DmsE family decaheme c-type cytochrome [Thiogranum sp.]|nr:DmsE family decaheme c-type cytochrome [Thiogranum sp.]